MSSKEKQNKVGYSFHSRIYGVETNLYINGRAVAISDLNDEDDLKTSPSVQVSGGIDSFLKKGTNLLQVDFKEIPKSHYPNWVGIERGLYNTQDKSSIVSIERDEYRYRDGKAVAVEEFILSQITFALNERGEPIISNTKDALNQNMLTITPQSNGYTRVTQDVFIDEGDAKPSLADKATIYNNNAHLQLLESAYIELWQTLNARDWSTLQQTYKVVTDEMHRYEPDVDRNIIYGMISPEEGITTNNLYLLPMHPFEKYSLETSSDGRMVRLYIDEEDGTRFSPIVYSPDVGGQGMMSISPYFSIINGKAVLIRAF